MRPPRLCLPLLVLLTFGCGRPAIDPSLVGTPGQRLALHASLYEKTRAREAFSPPKNAALGLDLPADLQDCADDFRDATDGHALFLAVCRMSNLRRDRHLYVRCVSERLFDPTGLRGELPLRFAADHGTPGRERLFVADLPLDAASRFVGQEQPRLGDVVTHVHGMPVAEWVAAMRDCIRYSTEAGAWEVLAVELARRNEYRPSALAPDVAELGLQRPDGSRYELTLPYLPSDTLAWQDLGAPRYPGFQQRWDADSFTLYEHADLPVILLAWKAFNGSCVADVQRLVDEAAARDQLDHAVIFDATRARGGSRGADVLRRLSPKPFRTTFGNLRISDATEAFIADFQETMRRRQVGASRLSEWLESDVARAIEQGDPYSRNVPFKLAHLPKDSDGVMQPAEIHFRGPLVCLFGPHGGSHLDQFAAMVIDNDLGHTIGLPTGGYSNTWEWTEQVGLPDGPPLVSFMWSIGQTIRPNGEVLEGNPAAVAERIPRTRGNHAHYHDVLLERALVALGLTARD